jgi:hypothetical protein
MSVLQTFEKIREYRQRAANYASLASSVYSEDVRARYLVIADHFVALADALMRADWLERKRRLEKMKADRSQRKRAWEAAPTVSRDLLGSKIVRLNLKQKTERIRIVDGRRVVIASEMCEEYRRRAPHHPQG